MSEESTSTDRTSQQSVEIVRRLYEAHSSEHLEAAARAICDPEIEWHLSEAFGVVRDAVLAHASYAIVFLVRGQLIVRANANATRGEALEAVGLAA